MNQSPQQSGDSARMLTVNNTLRVPLEEFDFSFARSGGPGGQNVNKVNTKALLRWKVVESNSLPGSVHQRFLNKYRNRLTQTGDLIITSQRYRDQGRNVADCLDKLRVMILAVATPPKVRKKTRPTLGSKIRKRKNKEAQSQKKQRRRPPGLSD
ncbi:MAG: alternative ribosome rescue aminoacyl-tRNA hydrolase ArfB [Planctomycetota bacterium]